MKLFAIIALTFIVAVNCAPVQITDNNVGDIVSVGVNANANIKSEVNQDIFSVIAALKNYERTSIGNIRAPNIPNLPDLPRGIEITPEMMERIQDIL
ncbi:CLUMA_CG017273, isoform A [Clunio marinus]|uniref:CLUMA_CG017273, isoform A n=1 Tax=Clunio marinus TaxID=568069 RepID=A0A1J1IWU0_9DIPT|nr:CLUMA_CG017273, isoform A [Clunio marinus]